MLGRLDDGTNESSTKRLMFQELLVDDSFVHSSKQPSIMYYRSTDFQYSMLGRLVAGTIDSSTDVPNIFFFTISFKIFCKEVAALFQL